MTRKSRVDRPQRSCWQSASTAARSPTPPQGSAPPNSRGPLPSEAKHLLDARCRAQVPGSSSTSASSTGTWGGTLSANETAWSPLWQERPRLPTPSKRHGSNGHHPSGARPVMERCPLARTGGARRRGRSVSCSIGQPCNRSKPDNRQRPQKCRNATNRHRGRTTLIPYLSQIRAVGMRIEVSGGPVRTAIRE
jgi:hypothetical protein